MPKTIKILYANWLPSAQKWTEITKKVKSKEYFTHSRGFGDIMVLESCGYCKQFIFTTCEQCLLYSKEVEGFPICHDHYLPMDTHFSFFVAEMQKDCPNFKIALHHAEVILNTILEDCPDKTRAIRDGIVFE